MSVYRTIGPTLFENVRIKKKIANIKGYTYKATHTSTAYYPRVGNIVPNYCIVIAFYLAVRYKNYLIAYDTINETLDIREKTYKKW